MKKLYVVLILALFVFILIGCSQSILGKFKSSISTVEFKNNGTYVYQIIDDDGSVLVSAEGTYKVQGENIQCAYQDKATFRTFKIKGNAIVDTKSGDVYIQ